MDKVIVYYIMYGHRTMVQCTCFYEKVPRKKCCDGFNCVCRFVTFVTTKSDRICHATIFCHEICHENLFSMIQWTNPLHYCASHSFE